MPWTALNFGELRRNVIHFAGMPCMALHCRSKQFRVVHSIWDNSLDFCIELFSPGDTIPPASHIWCMNVIIHICPNCCIPRTLKPRIFGTHTYWSPYRTFHEFQSTRLETPTNNAPALIARIPNKSIWRTCHHPICAWSRYLHRDAFGTSLFVIVIALYTHCILNWASGNSSYCLWTPRVHFHFHINSHGTNAWCSRNKIGEIKSREKGMNARGRRKFYSKAKIISSSKKKKKKQIVQ